MKNRLISATVALAFASPAFASSVTVPLGDTGDGESFSIEQPAFTLNALIQVDGTFDDIGQVKFFAGTFAPKGYQFANGSASDIASNPALFSKIGTIYGGDGQTNFRLPDLNGRTVVGAGGSFSLGQKVGSTQATLTTDNLPEHTHFVTDPSLQVSSPTGSGSAYNNMMPGLALDFEVVRQGVYPSRVGIGASSAPDRTIGFVTIDAANDGDSFAGVDLVSGGSPVYDSADGELIDISSDEVLFSLYGTTFGGDGRTTYGLPDTIDKVVVGAGNGPGISDKRLGWTFGENTETLAIDQMPRHTHTAPDGLVVGFEGFSGAQNKLQESIALNWLISLEGILPQRETGGGAGTIQDETQPLLGEMALFGGNFAPEGWAFAEGQMLSVDDNLALFSILGTNYGGDGRNTFGLPDMRGRVAVGTDFLQNFRPGNAYGTESVLLTEANLPRHNHTITLDIAGPPAVPLPAGVWLMLTALGGFGLMRRQ